MAPTRFWLKRCLSTRNCEDEEAGPNDLNQPSHRLLRLSVIGQASGIRLRRHSQEGWAPCGPFCPGSCRVAPLCHVRLIWRPDLKGNALRQEALSG